MLIGILSDTHDRMDKIREAVRILKERGVTHVIHAGDFVAPFALVPFVDAGFHLYAVYGNNDGEIKGLRDRSEKIGGIQAEPFRFELGGKRFVVYHHPQSKEREEAESRTADYFIYAHTHEFDHRKVGRMEVINPGELCGWLEGKSTFVLLDTQTGDVEYVELGG